MIYTTGNNRYLKYRTPLTDYIRTKHLYNNEKLIYTKRYSNGTFSITNPTKVFTNCDFINGYPHFDIPLSKCLDEINFFLSDESVYNNAFFIRYGDTHPHKSIPKLAQVRNLLIENSLSNMIGENAKSFYGLGDISLKSLNDFISINNINCTAEDLFKDIVNNVISNDISMKLNEYDLQALKKIKIFLRKMKLSPKEFLIESDIYKNQKLYKSLKNNPNYAQELKKNGELKYSLQELMFINYLKKNDNDIIINIIGANQISHVLKVEELLNGDLDIQNRFLTYGICKNAEDRDINSWSEKLNDFIQMHKLKSEKSYINYQDLLKILVIINSNDIIIDYNNLDKYCNNILKFIKINSSIDKLNNKCSIQKGNDLIYKMTLVCYNLNRSIEMGNPNNFYNYLLNVINEYETNKEKYNDIEGLYKMFLIKCFDRIGYRKSDKIKEMIK